MAVRAIIYTIICFMLISTSAASAQAIKKPRTELGATLSRLSAPDAGIFGKESDLNLVPLEAIVKDQVQVKVQGKDLRLKQFSGLMIEVHNGTERPLCLEGEKATATIESSQLQPTPVTSFDNAICPQGAPAKKVLYAIASTVISAVTIGGYPTIRDARIQAGPILQRYGCDETRREDELSFFARRIVWPGETTSGVIYFKEHGSLKGAVLTLPVNSLYNKGDQATITATR